MAESETLRFEVNQVDYLLLETLSLEIAFFYFVKA